MIFLRLVLKIQILKKNDPKLYSETLNNIFLNNTNINLNKKDKEILEGWFERFFDFQWKTQQDSWIISDGLRKLMDNDIQFFCINRFLFESDLKFFGDNIIYSDSNLNPWNYFDKNDTTIKYRFHTTLNCQEILADEWYKFFIKKNII